MASQKRRGRFHEMANGHISYEIHHGKADLSGLIAYQILPEKYGFSADDPLDGIDALHIDCHLGDVTIDVAWDAWSGCYIMPVDPPSGDEWIEEIGTYLDSILDELDDELFDDENTF